MNIREQHKISKALLSLFKSKKSWIQGGYAKDEKGRTLWGDDPEAVCWCLAGAARAVCLEKDGMSPTQRAAIALGFPGSVEMIAWNDTDGRTFKEVRDLLKSRAGLSK